MDDLIEVVTSTDAKVYLKPKLTYGQNRMVTQKIASLITADPITRKFNPITADIQMIGQEKALELLLVKVVDANGNIIPNPLEAVNNFDPVDGELVMDKVKEMYDRANPTKKNLNTSP